MDTQILDGIGLAATMFGIADYVPQLYMNYKNKTAEGLSMEMLALAIISAGLWLIYGYGYGDQLLIASSVLSILALIILVIQCMIYAKKKK